MLFGKRLIRSMPRMLPDHRSIDGKLYRRLYLALETRWGPFETDLVRLEAGRTALAGVLWMRATETWTLARTKRERGKGRRPSAQAVERLARRAGLQDSTYSAAQARLRDLVQANGHGQDLAARFAAHHREARRA